ncbi:MAG: hypothetical protein N3A61_04675 [Ignavibacteria bacterium]|nr:hypothetical protein [Ignavibacteria bacterium]
MIKTYISFVFIFILIFKFETYSQIAVDSKLDKIIRRGIEHIINQNYQKADSTFLELIKLNSKLPLGYLMRSAVMIAEAYDFNSQIDEKKANKLLKLAESKSLEMFERDKNLSQKNLYLGLIKLFEAYVDILNQNWFKAFGKGTKSIDYFGELLNKEKDNPEGLITVGSYKYWLSSKIEFLNWLPFIDDEREIGIELLQKGVSKDSYFKFFGINSLAWIYIHSKRYLDAIKLIEPILVEYPNSRLFLWILARAYEDVNLTKSIQLYKQVLSKYDENQKSSYNRVVLLHILAQKEFELKNYFNALNYLLKIEQIKIDEATNKKLEERLKRIKNLKQKIYEEAPQLKQ